MNIEAIKQHAQNKGDRELLKLLGVKVKEEKWEPKHGDTFFSVYSDGLIDSKFWHGCHNDRKRLAAGNVFRTEEEARESVIYAAFHGNAIVLPDGDYHYHFPWDELPEECPAGCEFLDIDETWRHTNLQVPCWNKSLIRRWPKQKKEGV